MKKFNITGVCVPQKHYMVNIDTKINQIKTMIENEEYFTINKARQYGKSTTISMLRKDIKDKYYVLSISFEGIDDTRYKDRKKFIEGLFIRFKKISQIEKYEWLNNAIEKYNGIETFDELDLMITEICTNNNKEIVFVIDEIDKSCDNELFLNFLGMLRNKYLQRADGQDFTFQSVILVGVHDVKNLKVKLRPNEERKYNSPWNIAEDFNVDMSFNPDEIASMLYEYKNSNKINFDIKKFSEEIYTYTKGYPFLVSKLCKVIDEELNKEWNIENINKSIKIILKSNNTLFDDIIKNLENNGDLYNIIKRILLEGESVEYNYANPILNKGIIYGVFSRGKNDEVVISNRIFELYIYNYLISKRTTEKGDILKFEYKADFTNKGKIDLVVVLDKFQELMKNEYREKDKEFIEREGRLLFLCFIKPIINGKGFYYVEPETRMDNRMDLVINYKNEEYIIELKKWYGKKKHEEGLDQLNGYLESRNKKIGFMVTFNFNKNKKYVKEWIEKDGHRIYSIMV